MGRRTTASMVVVVLALSGCGTTRMVDVPPASSSGATAAPSVSSSASSATVDGAVVPATLAEARRTWAQSRAHRQPYEVAVWRRCQECEEDYSYSTVDGRSVEVAEESTPGLPRTVDQLFAFIDKAQSGSGAVQAVYDRRGVPLWVGVDPDPSATDDEIVLEVTFDGAPAAVLPPGTDRWTEASDEALARAGTDRAAWIGTDDRLYLVIGGSGSCPPTPGPLTPITLAGASTPSLFLVDDTERPDVGTTAESEESAEDVVCTTDLTAYLFSSSIPAAVSPAPGSRAPVVMFESGDSESVMSRMATPWLER